MCTSMFTAALFTIVHLCAYQQMHKDDVEYYSAIKKSKMLPFSSTWMDLEGITLSEISQTEKDKRLQDNTCM